MQTAILPGYLTLQWHITEQCNLHCTHCYQEGPASTMSLSQCRTNLSQFIDLLAKISAERKQRTRGHINVTGGEPFALPWFPELLKELAAARTHLSFAILTNGTLITPEVAEHTALLKPGFVQVSIDGSIATHERIRGVGSYQPALSGLSHLQRRGVRTMISFTAGAGNYRDFPDVANAARRLKVSRLWVDRFIPLGNANDSRQEVLTPGQTLELCSMIDKQRRRSRFSCTEIAMHRALQFLVAGSTPYRCRAGMELIALMPDGRLLPCRRLPLDAGNVFETPLNELYFSSPVLNELREPAAVRGCERCFYSSVCGGGLRCLSYAVHGNPHHADPGCWLAVRRVDSTPASTV